MIRFLARAWLCLFTAACAGVCVYCLVALAIIEPGIAALTYGITAALALTYWAAGKA